MYEDFKNINVTPLVDLDNDNLIMWKWRKIIDYQMFNCIIIENLVTALTQLKRVIQYFAQHSTRQNQFYLSIVEVICSKPIGTKVTRLTFGVRSISDYHV